MDENYITTVRRSGTWYCETYCIKIVSGEIVVIRSLQ